MYITSWQIMLESNKMWSYYRLCEKNELALLQEGYRNCGHFFCVVANVKVSQKDNLLCVIC